MPFWEVGREEGKEGGKEGRGRVEEGREGRERICCWYVSLGVYSTLT